MAFSIHVLPSEFKIISVSNKFKITSVSNKKIKLKGFQTAEPPGAPSNTQLIFTGFLAKTDD